MPKNYVPSYLEDHYEGLERGWSFDNFQDTRGPQIHIFNRLFEQHPSHQTHSPRRRTPELRPTTIWGQYTTCCNSQSCAADDWQRTAWNMLSCFEDQ